MLLITCIYMVFAEEPVDTFRSADQSVMILPTAYTMPVGQSAITSYELLIIQYAYAFLDRAHLSAAMVFPVTKDMLKTFTFGTKVNYYRGKTLQAAVNCTFTPDPQALSLGNVFSLENGDYSFHLSTAALVTFKESVQSGYAGLGIIKNHNDRLSLMAELIAFGEFDNDVEYGDSLILAGIRFKGKMISWDLGAFRPLGEDFSEGSFIALPFVKATVMF